MKASRFAAYDKQESRAAYLFIVPAFALLAVFIFYPMVRALIISFQNYNLISAQSSFAGFANYGKLFEDGAFGASLWHSFYFTLVVLPVQTAISLGLALLVQKKFRGVGIFRTVYFLPVVVSFAIASTVFRLIYNKDYGMLNVVLKGLGLPVLDFLSNPDISMLGIIALCIWRAMGFVMVIFLAGLNNIPDSLYEAAHVDGAGPAQRFFSHHAASAQENDGFRRHHHDDGRAQNLHPDLYHDQRGACGLYEHGRSLHLRNGV